MTVKAFAISRPWIAWTSAISVSSGVISVLTALAFAAAVGGVVYDALASLLEVATSMRASSTPSSDLTAIAVPDVVAVERSFTRISSDPFHAIEPLAIGVVEL